MTLHDHINDDGTEIVPTNWVDPDWAPDLHGLIALARGVAIFVYAVSLFALGFLVGWLLWR